MKSDEEFQVKLRKKQQPEKAKPSRPNNTLLFLNWLESNKIVEFETSEFVSAYPHVTKKIADKIIVHQLQQGNLQQMGKDRFIVRDKNERNENSKIRDEDTRKANRGYVETH